MVQVPRTELIEVKENTILSSVCHQAKNLYNRANYLIKTQLQDNGGLLLYEDLAYILKTEFCYQVLPAQTAQQTLKLLTRSWKSYFRAKKEYKLDKSKFLGYPRPPKYKKKDGETVAIFTNQQVKIVNGVLQFPRKVPFTLKTRLTERTDLREVRIVPRGVGYTVEIIYNKIIKKHYTSRPRRKAAIDLGVRSLITFVDNIGGQPIVVKDEGKGIKSTIFYYNNQVKQLQNMYKRQQQKQLKNQQYMAYGRALAQLRNNKRKRVREWIHQVTAFFMKVCRVRCIQELIIGYNPLWKQEVRLGKKTTQMFVIIPFMQIIKAFQYKGEEQGIIVKLQPEQYTSKCSFLDDEPVKQHQTYAGRRVHTGLFRSAQGLYINSDVNAAFNIMRLSDPQALPLMGSVGGVGRYVVYPLRWSIKNPWSPICL